MEWPVQLWQKDLTHQLESKKDLRKVPVDQNSNVELYSECSPQFKKAIIQSLEVENSVVPEPLVSSSSTTNEGIGTSETLVPELWTVNSDKKSVSSVESRSSNLKGRLGHLMRAIDSQRSSSASTNRESMGVSVSCGTMSSKSDSFIGFDHVFKVCDKCDKLCYEDPRGYCSNCNRLL